MYHMKNFPGSKVLFIGGGVAELFGKNHLSEHFAHFPACVAVHEVLVLPQHVLDDFGSDQGGYHGIAIFF